MLAYGYSVVFVRKKLDTVAPKEMIKHENAGDAPKRLCKRPCGRNIEK
jgi:hypothetical protein